MKALRWPPNEHPIVFEWSTWYRIDIEKRAPMAPGTLPVLPRPGPMRFSKDGQIWAIANFDLGGITIQKMTGERMGYVQGPETFCDGLGVELVDARPHVAAVFESQLFLWRDIAAPPQRLEAGLPSSIEEFALDLDLGIVGWRSAGRAGFMLLGAHTSLTTVVEGRPLYMPTAVRNVVSVDIDPSGRLVAWISNPSWSNQSDRPNVSTWDIHQNIPGPAIPCESAQSIRFTTSSQLLIAGRKGESSLLWDLEAMSFSSPVEKSADIERRCERDSQTGALRVLDGSTTVWSESFDERIQYAFDSPGGCLAISTQSGLLRLVDVVANVTMWTVPFPETADLCFSASGKLAAVTAGGRVFLIDLLQGQRLARYSVTPGPQNRLAFTPDGARLAVAGVGGTLILLDTDPASWRKIAELRAGRTMTIAEREMLGLNAIPEW
jgi:hypothetical protein